MHLYMPQGSLPERVLGPDGRVVLFAAGEQQARALFAGHEGACRRPDLNKQMLLSLDTPHACHRSGAPERVLRPDGGVVLPAAGQQQAEDFCHEEQSVLLVTIQAAGHRSSTHVASDPKVAQ